MTPGEKPDPTSSDVTSSLMVSLSRPGFLSLQRASYSRYRQEIEERWRLVSSRSQSGLISLDDAKVMLGLTQPPGKS